MYCRICGTEQDVEFRGGNRGALCASCAKDTPRKAGRAAFDAAYWKGAGIVPESTKREFYSDYRSSTHTLAEYIERTTSAVM